MRTMVSAVMLVAIGWLTSGPSAQGLGEVARREADRRQQTSAGKKYTNEDLRAVPGEAAAVVAAPSTAAPASTGSASAAAPGDAAGAAGVAGAAGTPADAAKPRTDVKTAEQKRGEEYWRGKAGTIRTELERSTAKVDGLKTRLQNLDEQLRGGAGTSHVQEREVTLKALEKAQYNATSMREEWARFEARAKADKVPADWLR